MAICNEIGGLGGPDQLKYNRIIGPNGHDGRLFPNTKKLLGVLATSSRIKIIFYLTVTENIFALSTTGEDRTLSEYVS